MKGRASRWPWVVVGAVLLSVAGVGLSFWREYCRVQTFKEDVVAFDPPEALWSAGHIRVGVQNRAPAWLRDWVDENDHGTWIEWLNTDVASVHLRNPQTDDAWLQRIASFRNMRVIDLQKTQVTNAGLASLQRLSNLKVLGIESSRITDAGLASLSSLPNLECVILGETHITDAGLEHLVGMKNLQRVDLHRTQVTAAGIARFQARRPGVSISGP